MRYFYKFHFTCVTSSIFDVFYQKTQKTVDETEIPLSNQNTLLNSTLAVIRTPKTPTLWKPKNQYFCFFF